MRFLYRFTDRLEKVEVIVLAALFLIMLALAFLQVVMRNFFNSGIVWADSIVRLLVLWVGFFGAIVATKIDQHLTLEVLTKYIPERFKPAVSIAGKIFAIAICYFLFEASLRFLADERTTGEQFIDLIPSWWTLTIIPGTFALIAFHFAVNILKEFFPDKKAKKEEKGFGVPA